MRYFIVTLAALTFLSLGALSLIGDNIRTRRPARKKNKIEYRFNKYRKIQCVNHSQCNDNINCTNDVCRSGKCVNTIRSNSCFIDGKCVHRNYVNPGNKCLRCLPAQSKTRWSNSTFLCDDGNPNTCNDKCRNGLCRGIVLNCNDNIWCTEDRCGSDDRCMFYVKNGYCHINGRCYKDGDKDTSNQCRKCLSLNSKTKWTNDNGRACNDGNQCSYNDRCNSGTCRGTNYSCSDSYACTTDYCNGDGTCKFVVRSGYCLINGKCYKEGVPNPDNPCQVCRESWGSHYKTHWGYNNSNSCSDGDACTENDHCHSGKCAGTRSQSCNY